MESRLTGYSGAMQTIRSFFHAIGHWFMKTFIYPVPVSEEIRQLQEELLKPMPGMPPPPPPGKLISGWWGWEPSGEPDRGRDGDGREVQQRQDR